MPTFAIVRVLSTILVLLTAAGCGAVAIVAYKLGGPTPVEAKYVPAKEPTLVLIENFDNPSSHFVDSQRLTSHLSAELEKNKVVPLVDVDLLYKLRDKDKKLFAKMTIPQIGKAVGAKQVLYVNILQLDMETDGLMMRGNVSTMTKFIDVGSGANLWPTDFSEGFPLSAQTPYVRLESDASGEGVRQSLIRNIADANAKLFYKWTPVEGIK